MWEAFRPPIRTNRDPTMNEPNPPTTDDTSPPSEGGCGHAPTPQKKKRDVLLFVGAGLNVVAGALIGIPVIGFALASFFRKKKYDWISLGSIDQFPAGQTRLATYRNPLMRPWDGETGDTPCWVRRLEGEEFQVFAIHCTHLGCPVRWFSESKLFMCPCHGGVFYEDGSRASGPPPRGLYTYKYEIREGELYLYAGEIPSLANPNI